MRSGSRAVSNVAKMLLHKKYSVPNRSQSCERSSIAHRRQIESRNSEILKTEVANARSQQLQKLQEQGTKSATGEERGNIARAESQMSIDTKERRLNRAKDYLDQVLNAQKSRSKGRGVDKQSLLTHQELVEMQDKIDAKSQIKF